jgi:hypothetical protein
VGGVLIAVLVVAALVAIGIAAPKKKQKSTALNMPRFEPYVPLEMPQPAIQLPYTPMVAVVDPCLGATEAQCKRRNACRWETTCATDERARKTKCSDGSCRQRVGKVETVKPSAPTERKSSPTDAEQKSAVASPPTGTLARSRGRNAIAPFSIESEAGTNYLIKLVNVANDKDQILIYVKGGETYSTKVPLGSYRIRAASGQTWYGREDLFGPETQFFRLRSKKGSSLEEAPVFRFTQQGNKITGTKLSFKKVFDGNMDQEKISRNEF